jgi:hypothetical protein
MALTPQELEDVRAAAPIIFPNLRADTSRLHKINKYLIIKLSGFTDVN